MGKIRSILMFLASFVAGPILLSPNASQAMSAHDFTFVSIEG